MNNHNLLFLFFILTSYTHLTLAHSGDIIMSTPIDPANLPDRRDQLPLHPDQTLSGIQIDNQVKDDGLDEAVRRVRDEEGEGLTGKNQGISGAAGNRKGKDKGKGKGKGVVFANSHNDEMQKEPWVSICLLLSSSSSSCLSSLPII
jgi:hypothetical protein